MNATPCLKRHPKIVPLGGRVLMGILLGGAMGLGMATPAWAKVQVVASLPDLAAVARAVGGLDVEVTALAGSSVDPHFVDARPNLMLPLNRAQLLVHTGLGLEEAWLPTLWQGARNAKLLPGATGHFDASSAAILKQVPTGPISRAMGDVHPGGNPHYMGDPRNAARVGRAIAQRLTFLDPAHGPNFQARSEAFAKECESLAKQESLRFKALAPTRRQAVVYHSSLSYTLDWLGISQVNTLEAKAGIAPSPEHLALVLAQMRHKQVPAILQESYRPRNPAEVLARLAPARLGLLPGGPEGQKNYLEFMHDLCDGIYGALKP